MIQAILQRAATPPVGDWPLLAPHVTDPGHDAYNPASSKK